MIERWWNRSLFRETEIDDLPAGQRGALLDEALHQIRWLNRVLIVVTVCSLTGIFWLAFQSLRISGSANPWRVATVGLWIAMPLCVKVWRDHIFARAVTRLLQGHMVANAGIARGLPEKSLRDGDARSAL